MGFGDAIRTCFQKYVEFKGRASRPEYWWFFLSYAIVYVVGLIIVSSVKGLGSSLDRAAGVLPPAAGGRRASSARHGTFRLVVPDRADPVRRVHHPDRVPGRGGPAWVEPVRGSARHGGRRTPVPTAATARVVDRRSAMLGRPSGRPGARISWAVSAASLPRPSRRANPGSCRARRDRDDRPRGRAGDASPSTSWPRLTPTTPRSSPPTAPAPATHLPILASARSADTSRRPDLGFPSPARPGLSSTLAQVGEPRHRWSVVRRVDEGATRLPTRDDTCQAGGLSSRP